MQTKFMVDGDTIRIFNMNEDTAMDVLPPRVYTVKHAPMMGFYLEITKDKLELPPKIYGKTPDRVQKCLATYKDRTASTGILMTGDKGTGKTLLMSLLANEAITDLGLPVLLIKDAYAGAEFVSFIESIGECCIVFDEFGKMYASGDRHNGDGEVPQKALLTLLDGVDKTKRMFIMTENHESDINDFMLNRPSRLYYHFRYHKLDEASVIGYCDDKGVDDVATRDIIELSRRSVIFSFDMLQSIVEEHLRFGTTVEDVTVDLNIDTRESQGDMIEVLKIFDRDTEEPREIFDTAFVTKPNRGYTYIKVKANSAAKADVGKVSNGNAAPPVCSSDIEDCDEEDTYDEVYVQDSDLRYEKGGELVYETEHYTFVAKDVPSIRTDYMKMF